MNSVVHYVMQYVAGRLTDSLLSVFFHTFSTEPPATPKLAHPAIRRRALQVTREWVPRATRQWDRLVTEAPPVPPAPPADASSSSAASTDWFSTSKNALPWEPGIERRPTSTISSGTSTTRRAPSATRSPTSASTSRVGFNERRRIAYAKIDQIKIQLKSFWINIWTSNLDPFKRYL